MMDRAHRRRTAGAAPTTAGALVALLAFALAGCSEGETPPEVSAPPVMVVRAEARDLVERIEATGQLLAKAEAQVAAQVRGEVTHVAVDEGGAAERGAVILEIDPERRQLEADDAGARLVQAQAELDEAAREAARIEKLHARGAASQSQLDEARTALRLARSRTVAAEAQLGLARRAVRDSSVAAPFEGLIARRYVNVGEFVSAGQKLFDLVALDPIEVEFHLPEADSARVAVGNEVSVRVAPYPDESFEAKVSVVSPTIDEATRTLRVKAIVPNADGRLRPGLFARADLGVAHREAVVMIPEEALLQRADGAVVFRLVGEERVERLNVETGTYSDGWVEIRGGVSADDWIVVRGQTELVDGSAVSVRDAEGRPTSAAASREPAEGRDG
ncbi:MAG: efflux RND transporter periplasmic adaptor subunit [Myxococcota bacterium]